MALLNCARRFRDELFRKRKARAPCLEFLRVTSSYQEGGKNEARNCERIVATGIRGAAHKACTRGGKQAAIAFILGAWISFSNTPSARSFRWRGPSSSPCWLFRRQYTFFPELINANCTPFHFRLLDTPYLAFFYPPFSLTHAHTLSRGDGAHTRISILLFLLDSFLLPLSPSTAVCLSPLAPLSLYSLSSVPAWLLAADWVVEVCHSGYRPADTPNPSSSLAHSISPSRRASLSLGLSPLPLPLDRSSPHNRQTIRFPDALAHCAFNKELLALVLCENSL